MIFYGGWLIHPAAGFLLVGGLLWVDSIIPVYAREIRGASPGA